MRLTVDDQGMASGPFVSSSAFMRLRDQRKHFPKADDLIGRSRNAGGTASITRLSPDDVGDWIHLFVIGVQVPGMFCRVEGGEKGSYRLWLHDIGLNSWATTDYAAGLTEYAVMQAGPRKLWDELETAMGWWRDNGEPGFDRFGLTLDARGAWVWLDSPASPVPVAAVDHVA